MEDRELEVSPNWNQALTANQAERELKNFKFMGEGWYITDKDCVLVIPVPWKKGRAKYYRFYFFDPECYEDLKTAMALPVRLLDVPEDEQR